VGGALYSRYPCRVLEYLYIFMKIGGVELILQRQELKFPAFFLLHLHVNGTKIHYFGAGISIKLATIMVSAFKSMRCAICKFGLLTMPDCLLQILL
jgi:hypothetical protein